MSTQQTPPELYHYTCAHQAPAIEADGLLRPGPATVLPVGLVWLTDLEPPVPREAVGLTNHLVGCDRTEVCYRVDPQGVLPWSTWRNVWLRSQLTNMGTAEWRAARVAVLSLESAPFATPRHWWVTESTARILARVDARPVPTPVSSAD